MRFSAPPADRWLRGSERGLLAGLAALAVPLGFATRLYAGPGAGWLREYGGGVVYELFWILLALAIWPRLSPLRTAAAVLLATSALEVLQLWHPPPLEAIRGTFLGHALIGSTFAWWDFPHYLAGCGAGAWIGRVALSRRGAGGAHPRSLPR